MDVMGAGDGEPVMLKPEQIAAMLKKSGGKNWGKDWGGGMDWGCGKGWGGGKDWGGKGWVCGKGWGWDGGMGNYGKGSYQASYAQQGEWVEGGYIDGLPEALTECLTPIQAEEVAWSMEEMVKRIQQRILKASAKYAKDERAMQKGTQTQAQALIEEFVDSIMGALSGACHDKPWFTKVDFTGPFLLTVLHTFQKGKIFTRTIGPSLAKYVEMGIFKYREEERIQRTIWDALQASGVKESHMKKANQHLLKSYEDAHLKAPYGASKADTPEQQILQDFVRGWMYEFVGRSWDILEHGIGGSSRDEQVLFVTVLFQYLCDPQNMCVPHEIINALQVVPPSPWPYIAEAAEQTFNEAQAAVAGPYAKRRKGAGKFF